jgi:hypothetical protein
MGEVEGGGGGSVRAVRVGGSADPAAAEGAARRWSRGPGPRRGAPRAPASPWSGRRRSSGSWWRSRSCLRAGDGGSDGAGPGAAFRLQYKHGVCSDPEFCRVTPQLLLAHAQSERPLPATARTPLHAPTRQLLADLGPLRPQDGVPLAQQQLLRRRPAALLDVGPGQGGGGGRREGGPGARDGGWAGLRDEKGRPAAGHARTGRASAAGGKRLGRRAAGGACSGSRPAAAT